jgi:CBS domain-containing protein
MDVSQIMQRTVQVCKPEDRLSDAAKKMWDSDIGCLPVVDPNDQVIGIVTDRDICMAGYIQGLPLSEIPVFVAMSKEVFSCTPIDNIVDAEEKMQFHQVRRLPVIDPNGKLAGILSISDLAREAEREINGPLQEITPLDLTDTLATICQPRVGYPIAPLH